MQAFITQSDRNKCTKSIKASKGLAKCWDAICDPTEPESWQKAQKSWPVCRTPRRTADHRSKCQHRWQGPVQRVHQDSATRGDDHGPSVAYILVPQPCREAKEKESKHHAVTMCVSVRAQAWLDLTKPAWFCQTFSNMHETGDTSAKAQTYRNQAI